MKQNITMSQLCELSEEGKKRLLEWWKPRVGDLVYHDARWHTCRAKVQLNGDKYVGDYFTKTYVFVKNSDRDFYSDYPLLSIGQMIELLSLASDEWDEKWGGRILKSSEGWNVDGLWDCESQIWLEHKHFTDLCDTLWQVCKEVLETRR